jgi:hypothetical protein
MIPLTFIPNRHFDKHQSGRDEPPAAGRQVRLLSDLCIGLSPSSIDSHSLPERDRRKRAGGLFFKLTQYHRRPRLDRVAERGAPWTGRRRAPGIAPEVHQELGRST